MKDVLVAAAWAVFAVVMIALLAGLYLEWEWINRGLGF